MSRSPTTPMGATLAAICLWLSMFVPLTLYAVEMPQLVLQRGHSSDLKQVIYSHDGKIIASSARDGGIKLWDAVQGRLLRTIPGFSMYTEKIAFSTDDTTIVAADRDLGLKVADVRTGKTKRTIANAKGPVVFTPDGRFLLASTLQDGIAVIDYASGMRMRSFATPGEPTDPIAMASGGRYVALARADGSVQLWNWVSGTLSRTIAAHHSPLDTLVFNENAEQLATAASGQVRIWDTRSGKFLREISLPDCRVAAVAFHSKGHMLAVACGDQITVWDAASGQLLRTLKEKFDSLLHKTPVTLTFGPNGFQLVAGYGGIKREDNVVRTWDAKTGELLRTLSGHANGVRDVFWFPDGVRLASSDYDGVHWWNVTSRGIRTDNPAKSIWAATLSVDGKVAAHGLGSAIVLSDPDTGAVRQTLLGHKDNVTALSFSQDHKLLVSAGEDRTVRLWDVVQGQALWQRDGHVGRIEGATIRTDGQLLATRDQTGNVNLWTLPEGKLLETFKAYGFYSHALVFSPNRNVLAVSINQNVVLRDVITHEQIHVLKGPTSDVTDIAYSPDGRLIAASSADFTIRVWDAESGNLIHTLSGHDDIVSVIRFSPDGRFLLSGSVDATMQIWDVQQGTHVATLASFTDGRWVVLDAQGRFDTSDLEEIPGLHWVMPSSPLEAVPIELFIHEFYEPNLLQRLLQGERLSTASTLSTLNRRQPRVTITAIEPDGSAKTVRVTVQVDDTRDSKDQTAGISEVKLFRFGKLVASSIEQEVPVRPDTNGRTRITFSNIQLGHLPWDGQYQFSAYAFNRDHVKSATAYRSYSVPAGRPSPIKRRAYLVVIGVDAYDNPNLKLEFSVSDAELIGTVLAARLRKHEDIEEVVLVPLVSRTPVAQSGPIGAATKGNIRATLARLAGLPVDVETLARLPNGANLRKSEPDDVVIVAFSGHGFYEENSDFYLLPTDTGPGEGQLPTDNLLEASVSAKELVRWMRNIDAGTMALILDACHAGAVVGDNYKPGPMGSRGLGQLAYDKGMLILAATQADSEAQAVETLGHGYLTHALVQEGLQKGHADFSPRDGHIVLNEWLRYAVDRVPRLINAVRAGVDEASASSEMRPANAKPPVQQPVLFDFKPRVIVDQEFLVQ